MTDITIYNIAIGCLALIACTWLIRRDRWTGFYIIIVVGGATIVDRWSASRSFGAVARVVIVGLFMFAAVACWRIVAARLNKERMGERKAAKNR